jgi:hypothetical protein
MLRCLGEDMLEQSQESITTPKKGDMMLTLNGSFKNLFTAEAQRTQSFWFFFAFR